jgi:hypothetical protein
MKFKFDLVRGEKLESLFEKSETKRKSLEAKIKTLETKFGDMRSEMKEEIGNLRSYQMALASASPNQTEMPPLPPPPLRNYESDGDTLESVVEEEPAVDLNLVISGELKPDLKRS